MQSQFLKPVLSLLAVLLVSIVAIHGKKMTEANEENCEVCVKFLGSFMESLDADTIKDVKKIEKAFKKRCAKSKKDDNRFCYYVGGLEESATTMLGDIMKPVSYHMPADKICMKLYKKDNQICDLRYDKQLDLAKTNLKKLKVKDLKEILNHWEEQCRGCTEKSDYIKLIEDLMPKHAPDAHAARQKNTEL